MLRYYAVDLRGLYRGELSYRRLLLLMQQLPQDSRTQTVLRDVRFKELAPPTTGPVDFTGQPWALTNYQMASLIDAVRHNTDTLLRVNGNTQQPVPAPVARPGLNRPVAKQTQASVLYLDKLRARG